MISRAEFDALKKQVESSKIRKGVGYRLRRNGGGTVLDIQPGKGGGSSSHPFKVFIGAKPVSEGQEPGENGWQCHVTQGALFLSLKPDDVMAIDNLTLDDAEAPTYLTLLANDCIYLETTYTDDWSCTPETSEIKTWGESGTFDPTLEAWQENAYVEKADKAQTKSRVILAYTVAGDSGEPVLTQTTKTDLMLKGQIIAGNFALFPVERSGAYTYEIPEEPQA